MQKGLDHLDALYGYAFRLTRRHEEAEDLVQEAYTRLMGMKNPPSDDREFRPLLFRILHNAFVDLWRTRSRGPIMLSTDALRDEGVADAIPALCDFETPLKHLLRNGLSDEVEHALGELDEEWRETIWLREVEGFSYAEISEVTESPIGTVRSRLARAREALARKLYQYAKSRGFVPSAEPLSPEGRSL